MPPRNPTPDILATSVTEWQPADHAPFGQTVLAHYRNRLGKTRIVRATRVAPSGWYERLENGDYDYFRIDGIVTHYMPLPSPPEDTHATPTNP